MMTDSYASKNRKGGKKGLVTNSSPSGLFHAFHLGHFGSSALEFLDRK